MPLLGRYKIIGHSMEPLIKSGDLVLISNFLYLFKKPQINDIIAFKKDGKILIKRLVKINNENYFVLGDNKKDSFDSQRFGWIFKKDILGKFIRKL